jgi:hypothetical protein
MAFVPGYKHDIFVSYASEDDQPLYGAQEGWVTRLIKNLEVLLRQKAIRFPSLWNIHQLPENVRKPTTIMENIRKSATFVVILSPAYVESEWFRCQIDGILDVVKSQVRARSRVFVVERDRLDDEKPPTAFEDLGGYRFWVVEREGGYPRTLGEPGPERLYHQILNTLAHELAQELKKLKTASVEPVVEDKTLAPDIIGTVLLGEGTDDLYFIREEVKHYLEQFRIKVLPEVPYPRGPEAFQHAVRHDLARSDLFVQLLSDSPFKTFPDMSQGYERCQYELAQETEITIMQWRDSELDISTIQDPIQRDFLQSETVMAMGIEEFKAEIVKILSIRETPSKISQYINPLVFINAASADADLSERISQQLEQLGVQPVSPWWEGEPGEIRDYFEQLVLHSEALIIVYGEVPSTWVVHQEFAIRKILPEREEEPHALAIYEGPPPEKKLPLPYKLPQIRILDCRNGVDERQLREFVNSIRTRNGA